ncbi:ATPase domain-containing protein [Limnoglobus roseus]|uniref:non-specific serine/threonine protein kinase n=1 Tax=Limnoglobus roseus TaxID=2598579 RepID=A0A5C1AHT5_9BACT|nr:ATPase domain-containing protein [Limnoglobus roseus]QEL17737.1 circadian clock protein KaiC [Limnoglobus roseus]
MNNQIDSAELVPTGVPGLDDILQGGLPKGHLYLVEGDAGAGKTTLGLQFLLEGKRRGEKTLWISLSETEAQLRGTALSHKWDLSGIELRNLTHTGNGVPDGQYSFFSPADIELNDVTKAVMEVAEAVRPDRIVFDPFSDIKLLARDPLRYRRQVLELREYFVRRKCTVLLIQERTSEDSYRDPSAEGVVQGVLALYQASPDFGRQRRRLRVHKLRGVAFREGFHDVSILTGGMHVYPRLIAADHAEAPKDEEVSTGLPEFDAMLGGGIDRGASILIMGPAGVGKSTISSQLSVSTVKRGESVAVFLFDETERAYVSRGEGLGMGVKELIEGGRLKVRQVDPAEFTPGEFAHTVRREVEKNDVRLVVIDSLNGYLNGMPDERHLSMHLHELLTYLSYQNVVTVLTMNQHGFMGDSVVAPVDVSYLADAALLLRYFEAEGAVRRAASVMKRRCGPHEVHIREMTITNKGVQIGRVLTEFRGVLTGQPDFTGQSSGLSRAAAKGARNG